MTIARQPPSSLMTLGVFAQRSKYVVHNIFGALGKNPNMSARGALYTTREA